MSRKPVPATCTVCPDCGAECCCGPVYVSADCALHDDPAGCSSLVCLPAVQPHELRVDELQRRRMRSLHNAHALPPSRHDRHCGCTACRPPRR